MSGVAPESIRIRIAHLDEIASLNELVAASVRGLQREDYSDARLEAALASVYGVDSTLIEDGTYYVCEVGSEIVACGGWSKRHTLYGGDHWTAREDDFLDPSCDAAKIRAFFVHPNWARRGIGTALLTYCENAAAAEGFGRFEMGSTLTGVPFYRTFGYSEEGNVDVPLPTGDVLPVVRMSKSRTVKPE